MSNTFYFKKVLIFKFIQKLRADQVAALRDSEILHMELLLLHERLGKIPVKSERMGRNRDRSSHRLLLNSRRLGRTDSR